MAISALLSFGATRQELQPHPIMSFPRSPYDLTGGILYFARMCDKIRLHAAGELPQDYHDYLGKGFDGRICAFLRIDYEEVKSRVLSGMSDEEVLAWACETGRGLTDMDRLIWNSFARKRGWRDDDGGTDFLKGQIAQYGYQDRGEILTMFEFYEIDEGRA
jgi:Domain of unknown function (DUF5069)